MQPIRIHTPAVAAALPSAVVFYDQIAARGSLRSWWRGQTDKATLVSGEVSALAQIAGAAGLDLEQATAGDRPDFTDALFSSRYPGIAFDGVDHYLRTASIPYTKNGAFTWVFMGRMRTVAATSHIAALFATVGESTILRVTVTTNAITFQHGNGTVSITPTGTEYLDVPLCIIASSDGTTLNLRVNGLDATPAATNNAQTATTFVVGAANTSSLQPAAMDLADFLIFQEDVSADPAFRYYVEGYARRNYGVVFA